MPLVSATLVLPGPEKAPAWRDEVWGELMADLREQLIAQEWAIWEWEETLGAAGPELLVAVDAEPRELKRVVVSLEDQHPWGRIFDLDVVDPDLGNLSRARMGFAPRGCLVCGLPAAGCARSRAHSLDELTAVLEWMVAEPDAMVVARRIGALATEALRVEARLTPKPGLVDAENNGAHSDMDLPLLLASANALEPWFVVCAREGIRGAGMDELRTIGLAAEAVMLAATGGVNTHKGALFALGLLCAAAGTAWVDHRITANDVCARAGAYVAPELGAWQAAVGERGVRTHGERALVKYGLSGARGEAAAGFPTARAGLAAYRATVEVRGTQVALLLALLEMLTHQRDTNLAHRGGADALADVAAWARATALSSTDGALFAALRDGDTWFIERNWSPGGTADLLAVVWFLDRWETTRVLRRAAACSPGQTK